MRLTNGVVGITFIILFSSACTHSVRPTGYLEKYDQLGPGHYLELFWSDPDRIVQGQYKRIVIGRIEARVVDSEKVTGEEACKWLRYAVLGKSASSETLVLGGETGKTAKLDLAITEMTPGSAFARIMAGELGAGHAWLQIEGYVTDEESSVLLVSFADRRRGSGAHGFRDVVGDSGPAMIGEGITAIGYDIRRELAREFGL